MIKILRPLITPIAACMLLLALSVMPSMAQDKTQKGGIRHEVQPLETFYSLSKKYGVTIDEIKQANPGVDYPKAGMFLIIPVNDPQQELDPEFIIYTTQEEVSIYILARMLRYPVDSLLLWNPRTPYFLPSGTEVKSRPADPATQTITHKVVDERSSLRDLSDLYNVPYRTLREFNPDHRNRVWQGQKVSVPVLEEDASPFDRIEATGEIPVEPAEEEADEPWGTRCRKDPANLRQEYRVALLVPFSLEELYNIDATFKGTPASAMDHPSFRFIPFYQGFVLAADTLTKEGLKLDLAVYDVDQDISKAREVVSRPEMKEMDLIIGPFYKNSFPVAADFARRYDIPVVNPLSAREDILVENPYVFKVIPSIRSQVDRLSDLVKYRFYDHNFIVVRENKYQGTEYTEAIRNSLREILQREIPEVIYMTDSIGGVEKHLSELQSNMIVIYSESEILPVEILPQLYELNEDYDIEIIGLPEWDKFEQLEYKYLIDLHAYLFSGMFIDFNEPRVKEFISRFRHTYHAEPVEYAYNGYDIGYYFLSLLMDYGEDFMVCLNQADYTLLQTRYRFTKAPEGGYLNTYWNAFYFRDYSRILIPGY